MFGASGGRLMFKYKLTPCKIPVRTTVLSTLCAGLLAVSRTLLFLFQFRTTEYLPGRPLPTFVCIVCSVSRFSRVRVTPAGTGVIPSREYTYPSIPFGASTATPKEERTNRNDKNMIPIDIDRFMF